MAASFHADTAERHISEAGFTGMPRVAWWGVSWSYAFRSLVMFLRAVNGAERLPWPPAQGERGVD